MRMRFAVLALAAVLLPAGAEDQPGQEFQVSPAKLPAPYATPGVDNHADTIARPAKAMPKVMPGFTVEPYVTGLANPRFLALGPNGDVYVTETRAGKVSVIRNGKASDFAAGFSGPSGIAFHNGALYVGDLEAVWRVDPATKAKTRITKDDFGGRGGHSTRTIAFGPDGTLYLAIGSASNVSEEKAPRATVQVVGKDGHLTTFASGTRNPVGIALYPGSNDLYVTVNERDGLGDGLPPDYFTRLQKGDFLGWPYAYIGPHPDPDFGSKRPDLVKKTKTPDVLFQPHSAPLGVAFYDGKQFPAEYKGNAFVALHGSWDAAKPTGFKVVRVKFANGKPQNAYQNFATGFWSSGTTPPKVWGRPVGLLVDKDGSLLIADDVANIIWRVRYAGK
ncbi:PQQ-dependent sugar dehydrogenase [Rhizomicrobium electricum]|uniref:Sorbosone dehydrogenase family protein n=1 Tax=Rhizomicrobium electricum TaxID=480070 RepID=A0ABP3Q1V3_9PROT|nr:PQQ-dependent sugar dehydrogenase [Rhizomicrobium electricum]NIJ49264.1 glucose/arabinose dehydrogenase [Rhizomicrobium electricum]